METRKNAGDRLDIRLTDDEKNRIRKAADYYNMSMSQFIRRTLALAVLDGRY